MDTSGVLAASLRKGAADVFIGGTDNLAAMEKEDALGFHKEATGRLRRIRRSRVDRFERGP
jgi:hypothetical protein